MTMSKSADQITFVLDLEQVNMSISPSYYQWMESSAPGLLLRHAVGVAGGMGGLYEPGSVIAHRPLTEGKIVLVML